MSENERRNAAVADSRYRSQLTFFARARSFGAAVALGEFFNATGRVHEFLFAGEKRMTSSAYADSNIATRRARMIHSPACTDHIRLVIFRMNAGFHVC